MEKVKVREQGKEGENDNKISLKIKISPLINQNGYIYNRTSFVI